MQLLDEKKTAEDIKGEIAVQKMKNNGESTHLAAIVGNDGASLTYVGSIKDVKNLLWLNYQVPPLKPN
jgi:methylenetetrahydrofolate dehydrogenase (NADP+)/methenyltetrahydrofolate cyclohydrolase